METQDFFKDFVVKVNDKEYKLKYTINSFKFLEENGINLNRIESHLLAKPISTISCFLYAGLPLKVKEELSFNQFCEEFNAEDLEKLAEKFTKAQEAMQHGMPEAPEGNIDSKKNLNSAKS